MKLGIIADIHANKPALEATLDALHNKNVDAIACIGDIIGVLGSPNECINLIREHADYVVFGNHDARLFDEQEWMPVHDFEVVEYEHAMEAISDENYSWLTELPSKLSEAEFILVHANPLDKDDPAGITKGNAGVWPSDFISVGGDVLADGGMLFLGHTHEQHAVNLSKFDGQDGLILNPGSVGFPFNHENNEQYGDGKKYGKASYAIVDTETQEYTLETVLYDSQPVHDFLEDAEIS